MAGNLIRTTPSKHIYVRGHTNMRTLELQGELIKNYRFLVKRIFMYRK